MALSGTNRGTGGNNTGAATIACAPTSTIVAGSLGVLCIAVDNAGAGGASTISPGPTVNDSVGNVWTQRLNTLYDPGAASAGVEIAIYTGAIVTQLTSGNNLTITWVGASPVAKAYTFTEIVASVGVPAFKTGGLGTGSATGTPTITTSSIVNGEVVIGMGGAESASTWTGDADTSNGTWSTQQAVGFGTGTSGMSVTSQFKVVTATATQTYNPTLTSADVILAWISIEELLSAPMDVIMGGGYYG